MAIIKMKPPKVGKPSGLFFLIRYICDIEKTEDKLIFGKDCDPKNAYSEMYLTKQNWNKLDGRQYCHIIQSFSPRDKVTPELAHEIGRRLIEEFPQFQGFEIVMATHKNRGHIHNHFAVNSVNAATGLKWEQKAQDLYRLKEFSNKLCGEYALAQIKLHSNKRNQSYGEWKNRRDGTSWKAQLEEDIRDCLSWCRSKEEFFHSMKEKGYAVTLTKERKYITFENSDSKKCRNNKLSDVDFFSKNNMLQMLQDNADDLNFMENDADLFVDALHEMNRLFSGNGTEDYFEAYAHRDLDGLTLKELLIVIHQLKTEQELKRYRLQCEQERQSGSRQFSQAISGLADELERWLEEEDLEI